MRLTRQSEIAVGILVACARSQAARRPIRDLALVTGTTPDHAAQIVALLGREGFLTSARGRGGGLSLARPAGAISLLDVLCLMQPEIAAVSLPGNPGLCPFGQRFAAAIDAASVQFLDALRQMTVADLALADHPGPAPGRCPHSGAVQL